MSIIVFPSHKERSDRPSDQVKSGEMPCFSVAPDISVAVRIYGLFQIKAHPVVPMSYVTDWEMLCRAALDVTA